MPASYKHPRSEPKARRVSLRTTGRSLMPSRGGAAKPLRHERTWSGPNPSLSSTPSNNPFYIPPSDTAPSTPVAADIEAFKQSFPKLPSGGRENQDEVTPTPLTRQHAVIIHGKPLGAERRTGSHVELRSTGAKAEASIVQSSPISIKIESSPTQLELILKGVLPIFSSPVDETQNVSNTHSTTARAGTRTSPTAKSSSQPSSSKRPLDSASDHQSRKARRTSRAGSSTRNPIEELVLQWAQEALEEEEAVTGEDLFHLPPFSRLPPPPQQTRYNLRDRARVVKQETVFAGRTEQDYVDIRPAFFRKAAIKTFNPARLPVLTIDLLHNLCSRTPRGLTVVEFSKVFLQCESCSYYHYAERLEQHSCSAPPVQTTEYRSIEYDIGIDFLGYRRRGISEERLKSIFITCTLCDRVFLRKYNRSHICDSDQ